MDEAFRGVRRWTVFFVVGLVVSGATALPIPTQLALAVRVLGEDLRAGGLVPDVARRAPAVAFVLRETIAVPDPFTGGGHAFLVPDEGRAAIAALHDRLYDGPLRAFLRDDLPFVPHVTVGAAPDVRRCEEIRDEVARPLRATFGTIGSLDVLEIGDDEIRTAARFDLTGHIEAGERWQHESR